MDIKLFRHKIVRNIALYLTNRNICGTIKMSKGDGLKVFSFPSLVTLTADITLYVAQWAGSLNNLYFCAAYNMLKQIGEPTNYPSQKV